MIKTLNFLNNRKPYLLYMVEREPQKPNVSLALVEGCSSQMARNAHCNWSGTVRENRGHKCPASVLISHWPCLARVLLAFHKQMAFVEDAEQDCCNPAQGMDYNWNWTVLPGMKKGLTRFCAGCITLWDWPSITSTPSSALAISDPEWDSAWNCEDGSV